jgi:alpha-galactosidase/6-phospho-beta-glucosidase family protein
MSLDLSNSNKLDDDFSNYIMVGVGTIQRKKRPYPRFSEMNTFNDGIPAKIESVADTDYEYTPYGYTTDRVYEKPREEYSNFRLFGIGEESEKQKERREKRKEKKEERKDKRKSAKDERRKMPFGKRFVNIANKYNPAVAVPRTSALTSIRLNHF